MIKIHNLKTWPTYFEAIENGSKSYEVRKNDRFFQKGDTVVLHKMSHDGYSAGYDTYKQKLTFTIGDILTNSSLGVKEGYCIFSLLPYKGKN